MAGDAMPSTHQTLLISELAQLQTLNWLSAGMPQWICSGYVKAVPMQTREWRKTDTRVPTRHMCCVFAVCVVRMPSLQAVAGA